MMKTRVNLYTAEFRPNLQRLTLATVLALISFMLLLLLLVSYSADHGVRTAEQDVTAMETQLTALENEISLASDKAGQHEQSPALSQRLLLLEQRLHQRQEVLATLSDLTVVQESGFSGLMADLAHLRDADIRLTAIKLNGGRITLIGLARTPASIPRWISTFSQSKALAGKTFDRLTIDRGEQGLAFQLSNSTQSTNAEAQP